MTNTNQILFKKPTIVDLPRIHLLLEELDLPTIGVSEHLDDFFISVYDNTIIGIIGLEIYDKVALLRSVGVKPSYQGHKIGDDLMTMIFEYAKFKSIEKIYLFTDTASKWFERYDFVKISNDELDPILLESKEYTLCESSVKMVLPLEDRL